MSAPLFVRVRSLSTGHEFDVREDSLLFARGAVVRVKPIRYPAVRYPRPPKYRLDLAGHLAGEEAPTPSGGDDYSSPDPVED